MSTRRVLPPGRQFHGVEFLPHSGTPPEWPPGDGPVVFAYLKSAHPDHAAVLQALVDAGCRVACYLPELGGGKVSAVTHADSSGNSLILELPAA